MALMFTTLVVDFEEMFESVSQHDCDTTIEGRLVPGFPLIMVLANTFPKMAARSPQLGLT